MQLTTLKDALADKNFMHETTHNFFYASFDGETPEEVETLAEQLKESLADIHPALPDAATIDVSDTSYESDEDAEAGINGWTVSTVLVYPNEFTALTCV